MLSESEAGQEGLDLKFCQEKLVSLIPDILLGFEKSSPLSRALVFLSVGEIKGPVFSEWIGSKTLSFLPFFHSSIPVFCFSRFSITVHSLRLDRLLAGWGQRLKRTQSPVSLSPACTLRLCLHLCLCLSPHLRLCSMSQFPVLGLCMLTRVAAGI